MKRLFPLLLMLTLFGTVVKAETISLQLTIPAIESTQYQRPFVAIWLEEKGGKDKQPFAVWFDDAEWLKDIRRWWRKVGRYDKQVDAYSSATKPAGQYDLSYEVNLEADKKYTLYIEAVREHGNRTLLKLPISKAELSLTTTLEAGKEIGPVIVTITEKKQ